MQNVKKILNFGVMFTEFELLLILVNFGEIQGQGNFIKTEEKLWKNLKIILGRFLQ